MQLLFMNINENPLLRWMETGYKASPELLADQAIELLKTASLGFIQKKPTSPITH